MKISKLLACAVLAALSTACMGFERQSTTGPSAGGMSALMGSWSSSNLVPSPSSCADFKWNVREQTATSAKGSFSASCAGDLRLAGTAEGTLSGSTINWSAQGTASAPGLTSCNFALTGTAVLGMDAVRVPYSGTTCLGAVQGEEILRKR